MNQYSRVSKLATLRPLLRSLLQKAVRRGYVDLAQQTAFLLASQGDSTWLRARTGVIVFEECWPNALILNSNLPSAVMLQKVTVAIKNKDAAGLGSLAHALVEGDITTLEHAYDKKALKIVAAGLKRPEDFFKWVRTQCQYNEQINVVSAAQLFFSRASWPWDKAFLVAGAYLSTQIGIQDVKLSEHVPNVPFPYWAAIDKHTPQGKSALRSVANAAHLAEDKLQWASFYFESAKSNEISQSPWWECETTWRFNSLGLSLSEAEKIWCDNAEQVKSKLQDQANVLRKMVEQSNSISLLIT